MALLTDSILPVDLRFIAGSSFGGVYSILFSLSVSLHMDFIWLWLASMSCIMVGLVWVCSMCCRTKIVSCMPLVSNVAALMSGCRYASLASASPCVCVCVVLFVFWVCPVLCGSS